MLLEFALTCLLAGRIAVCEDGVVVEEQFLNVAIGKPTSQSNVGSGGVGSRAVDGNTDGNYNHKSCSHSNNGGLQWWEVDLEAVYKIAYIEVWGRTDCCSSKIKGAKLWVGNNKCATLNDMGAGQVEKVECGENSVGRKVRIELIKAGLTICEVKVMVKSKVELGIGATETPAVHKGEYHGDLLNVAVHKQASNSATKHGGLASRAVDGYTNGHWNDASCSYSQNSRSMAYWEVDLGRVFNIDHMMVYGRTDREQNYLDNAVVKVGDVACQTLSGMAKENKVRIDCSGDKSLLTGRHVRIEKWDGILTVCEFQVFVDPKELPEADAVIPTVNTIHLGQTIGQFFNVAKGKNSSSSSAPWSGSASRANDGVTNQNYNQASCAHTDKSGNQWWEVDLGRVYQVDHVRVWGRDDRASELKGARLWIGDHRCGTLDSKKKGEGPDIIQCPREQSAGRSVMIEHFNKYMVLCEVQVMVDKGLIDVEPNTLASDGEVLGNYTNVALKKDSWQTSTAHGGVASRANDGWGYTHWSAGTCTHTSQQGSREWRVDLGKVYKIDSIRIWSRTDCCQDYIKWARVYVGHTVVGYIGDHNYDARFPIVIGASGQDAQGQIVTVQKISQELMLCEVQVMVRNEDLGEEEIPSTIPQMYNVAQWKPTNQSSEAHGGVSSRAVDNYVHEYGAEWNRQSCIHTEKQEINYWEVDLEKGYYIDRLFILARSDCCRERMHGVVITMDGNTVAGLQYADNAITYNIPMFNAFGRRFKMTKLKDYLNFCEFAVYANTEFDPSEDSNSLNLGIANLAHKKVATSSSASDGGDPSNGIDGDTDGNFFKESCVSTAVQQGVHWWSVDLIYSRSVGDVIVYPRLDENNPAFIHGATVYVGTNICGQIEFEQYRRWYVVDCKGQLGSSVSIKKEVGYLQFCEVIVQDAQQ